MAKRRKKWKAPGSLTPVGREVWKLVYPGEPWPKGWKVEWAGFMRGALGLCIYRERRVLVSHGDAKKFGILGTLVHELVHVRSGPQLRHGKDFVRLENAARARVGLNAKERHHGARD